MFRGKRAWFNFGTIKVRHTFWVMTAALLCSSVQGVRAGPLEDLETWSNHLGESVFGFENSACRSTRKAGTAPQSEKLGEQPLGLKGAIAACLASPNIATEALIAINAAQAGLNAIGISTDGDARSTTDLVHDAEAEYRWMYQASARQLQILDANDLRMGRLTLERQRSKNCTVGAPYKLDHYCTERARTLSNLKAFLQIEGQLKNARAAQAMKWEKPEVNAKKIERLEAQWKALLNETPLIGHPKLLAYATDLGFGHYDSAISHGFNRDFSDAVNDVASKISEKRKQIGALRSALTPEDRRKFLEDHTLIQELVLTNQGSVEIKDPTLLSASCRLDARISAHGAMDVARSLTVNSLLMLSPLGIGGLAKLGGTVAKAASTALLATDVALVGRDFHDLGNKANECRNYQALGLLKDAQNSKLSSDAQRRARECEKEYDELAAMAALGTVTAVGGNLLHAVSGAEKAVFRAPAKVVEKTPISVGRKILDADAERYLNLSEKERAEFWSLETRRTHPVPEGMKEGFRVSEEEFKRLSAEVAKLSSSDPAAIGKRAGELLRAETPLVLLGEGGLGYVFKTRIGGRDVIVKVPKYTSQVGFYSRNLEEALAASQTLAKSQAMKSSALNKMGVSTVSNTRIPPGDAGTLGLLVADYLPTPEALKNVHYRKGVVIGQPTRPAPALADIGEDPTLIRANSNDSTGVIPPKNIVEDKTGVIPPKGNVQTAATQEPILASAGKEAVGIHSFQDYVEYLKSSGRIEEAENLIRKVDGFEQDVHEGYDHIMTLGGDEQPSMEEVKKLQSPWEELWQINDDLGMAPWSLTKNEDSLGIVSVRVQPDGDATRRNFPLVDVGQEGANLLPRELPGVSKEKCNSHVSKGTVLTLRVFDFGICIEWVLADP